MASWKIVLFISLVVIGVHCEDKKTDNAKPAAAAAKPAAGGGVHTRGHFGVQSQGGSHAAGFSGHRPGGFSGHNPAGFSGHNPGGFSGHNPGGFGGHRPGGFSQGHRGQRPGGQPFNPAFNQGRNPGFNQGVNPGFNPGFNPGLNQGVNPGLNHGFNPGLNHGINPGLNNGFNQGCNPSINPRCNSGFTQAGLQNQYHQQANVFPQPITTGLAASIPVGGGSVRCIDWCNAPEGTAVYCCKDTSGPLEDPNTRKVVKPNKCPVTRKNCPLREGPQSCSHDGVCFGTDKCCFDKCLERHVCKPALLG